MKEYTIKHNCTKFRQCRFPGKFFQLLYFPFNYSIWCFHLIAVVLLTPISISLWAQQWTFTSHCTIQKFLPQKDTFWGADGQTGGEWQGLGKFGHVSLSLKPLQSLIQGLALHSTLTLKSPLNALKKILFSMLPVSIVIIISVIFIITVWEEMVCRGVCWSSPWLGNNIISINGNENTLSPQSQKPKRLQADNVRFGKPYNTSLKLWFSMSFLHQFIMTNY